MVYTNNELLDRFLVHVVNSHARTEIDHIRSVVVGLAVELNNLLPEGRESALALTHLEEVMMWSTKALVKDFPISTLANGSDSVRDDIHICGSYCSVHGWTGE